MAYHGMESYISTVTREEIRDGSITRSCIDHAYCRGKQIKYEAVVYKNKVSDHYPIIIKATMEGKKVNNERNETDTIIRYNEQKIVKELNEINWEYIPNNTNVEIMYNMCVEKIRTI